jgi:hypothetical protein
MRIEQHQKGEGDFRTTLEGLISLASRAAELFEGSKPEQEALDGIGEKRIPYPRPN